MTIRVLVVDDSSFMCNRIAGILQEKGEFKVIGTAANGRDAVKMTSRLKPDVITMDVEMPLMNGIAAVNQIMAECPTPILMLSALTHVGAQSTLEALNAGAIDFLPKQLDEIDGNTEMAKGILRQRVRIVAQQVQRVRRKSKAHVATDSHRSSVWLTEQQHHPENAVNTFSSVHPDLLLIAASTGGPVAIQKILTRIPAGCSFPVVVVQHMPENFTRSFASRLNQLCNIGVKEAGNDDELEPGVALVCPGGMQLELGKKSSKKQISLRAKSAEEIYSPCVDITFASVAEHFSGRVLAVVLTGMGADGKEGVKRLKRRGAKVWVQDEASSTIYGMPKAIVDADLADSIFSLDRMAIEFNKLN